MEGDHHLPRMADGEQPRLDLEHREAEQREAFPRAGKRSFAGHVEHAKQRALRPFDRHRGTGETAQAVEEVFATIDLRGAPFHQRSTQRIGAARGFAPAGALDDVGQALALHALAGAFDGKNGGVGVGQDDHAVVALALLQVIELGSCRVQQQAVAGQQHVGFDPCIEPMLGAVGAVQAMAQAAPPGSVDLLAEHAAGHFALLLQVFTGKVGFAQQVAVYCSCGHASLR